MEVDQVEDEIYEHQRDLVAEKYGLIAAESANYGWGVDDTDDYISVATKVYVPGMKLVTNVYYDKIDEFEDKWESL